MSRVIKFRGIIKDGVGAGQWIYGSLYVGANGTFITDSRDINLNTHSNIAWFEVVPETVGQYSEMGDKNNKDVFAGDILKSKWKGNEYELEDFEEENEVLYSFGSFTDQSGCPLSVIIDCAIIEIIGNIHDNPELKP